mmetsp:Transcript_29385/g.49363  ORF Transcript_29385/g.49363 Transcript_29385/m.49363 type:complete len:89 (-) Transcript_29385:410-676(-)
MVVPQLPFVAPTEDMSTDASRLNPCDPICPTNEAPPYQKNISRSLGRQAGLPSKLKAFIGFGVDSERQVTQPEPREIVKCNKRTASAA